MYIYIYIFGYLINCEYFNNLNENRDMAGMSIMAEICTFPYLIEKVGDSPYPYAVNVGILRQNGNRFEQYSRGRVYLPSLSVIAVLQSWNWKPLKEVSFHFWSSIFLFLVVMYFEEV